MKVIQNNANDLYIKSLDPLEYTANEEEAEQFEDEQIDDILDEEGILREHPEPAQPHTPKKPTHHPDR